MPHIYASVTYVETLNDGLIVSGFVAGRVRFFEAAGGQVTPGFPRVLGRLIPNPLDEEFAVRLPRSGPDF